jgi:hypothetical protein
MSVWKLQHPFTARICGPSQCGKTTFLKRLLSQRAIIPFPSSILYFYGSEWQARVFDELKKNHGVVFIKGYDDEAVQALDKTKPNLVILDDLMKESADSSEVSALFYRGCHHQNLSVILLEQSLFPKGKQSVQMKSNTHYTIAFKNPADQQGVACLAKQITPRDSGFIVNIFNDATRNPFSYLVFDCKQETPDSCRFLTNILGEQDPFPTVYVKKEDADAVCETGH